ncbi:O-methylsterigmatocystin oxidoreductase [Trametes pubescens]|uniref:O-methylsterigmatocystin oxidoreductase n=1 Tax=Trametes pubescens TaxID=154538 RepID=A0A1M2V382_TRAPU|nr:O-methylsterigmatocystin oxidoreductase [Trametes pubescens]
MSQYPDVQKKTHAELDRVIGPDCLPDFGDREELVYMNAVIKEALRWHVVVPLSLPHRTVEDDVYGGYFVPAGTMVVPNTWAMLHDPNVYERPEEFKPERFIRDGKIDTTVYDPSAFAFGYGRRVCPGRYFADDLLYITAASVLHVFRFDPPLDEQGLPIKIELQQSHGLLS